MRSKQPIQVSLLAHPVRKVGGGSGNLEPSQHDARRILTSFTCVGSYERFLIHFQITIQVT